MPRAQQAIEHLHGAAANRLAGNGVILPGHDGRLRIRKGRGPGEIACVAFVIRHRARGLGKRGSIAGFKVSRTLGAESAKKVSG